MCYISLESGDSELSTSIYNIRSNTPNDSKMPNFEEKFRYRCVYHISLESRNYGLSNDI
jgi:hypothetical protein